MTRQQKWVLWMAILASFVAFLDGSVTNVALPAISAELGGGLATQQWVNDAYLITLGSLILAAGSFSYVFGRKKVIMAGLYGFLLTSLMCAVSPTDGFLIVSRVLQGVAGALLVPSSLAFIISSFKGKAQAKAIGTWTAWTGIAFIIGPLVGGFLVDVVSWRLVFVINVVPIILALGLLRMITVKRERTERKSVDVVGMVLCAVGLAGIVYGLIEQVHLGWSHYLIVFSLVIGVLSLVGFLLYEKKVKHPMLPFGVFGVRNFSYGNVSTFFIYAALALQGFILVIFLQEVAGYTATLAGLASLPITILLFLLSSKFGALAGTYGPRLFMTLGPFICSLGVLLLLMTDAQASYWYQVFPGVVVFGLGLAVTVAPLTSAILGSISEKQAGIGSAINNAVARIAGLLAIAAIGLFLDKNTITLEGFHRGILVCAVLLAVGAAISYVGIRNEQVIHE